MTDHSDLIERARAYRPYNHLNDGDLVRQLLEALSSQSLSLSEARAENDRKDAEIERLKGLVAGIRECPQEPVGWTFEFLGHDGEWGRAFAFFDQGEPANGTGAIVRNVVPVRRAA